MDIRFQSSLICVKDIKVTKKLGETILEQQGECDFGGNILFRGRFAIRDANHISNLLFNRQNPNMSSKLG